MLWFGKKKSEPVDRAFAASEFFVGVSGQRYTVPRNAPMSPLFMAWIRYELEIGRTALAETKERIQALVASGNRIRALEENVTQLTARVQNPPCIIFDARTGEPVAIKVLPNCGGEKVKESVKDAGVGIFAFDGKKYNVLAMSKALDELADENNRVHKAFKALQHEHNCLLDRRKAEAEGSTRTRAVRHEHIYTVTGQAAIDLAAMYDDYHNGPEASRVEASVRLWQFVKELGVPVSDEGPQGWSIDPGQGVIRVCSNDAFCDDARELVVHHHEIDGLGARGGKCKCK